MHTETFEVEKYLRNLQDYFLGDIREFEKLCTQIELEEMERAPNFNKGSMYDPRLYEEFHRNKSINSSDRFFRLTIPITLSLFSAVDVIGFLISENRPGETEKNFISFFDKSARPLKVDEVILLNRIFRQGLTHVYFPKLNFGVKFHSTNPTGKLFFKNKDEMVFLNVNLLKDIVVSTVQTIVDNALYLTMERKYRELITEYQRQIGNEIKHLNFD